MNLRHALDLGLGSAVSLIHDNVAYARQSLRDACLHDADPGIRALLT